MSYEKLPQTKLKNGYRYTLVKRNDTAAMYAAVNEKFPEDTSKFFEVFKIIITPPYTLVQKSGQNKGHVYSYPASEKFPGDADFGLIAWTYDDVDEANKKFDAILHGVKKT